MKILSARGDLMRESVCVCVKGGLGFVSGGCCSPALRQCNHDCRSPQTSHIISLTLSASHTLPLCCSLARCAHTHTFHCSLNRLLPPSVVALHSHGQTPLRYSSCAVSSSFLFSSCSAHKHLLCSSSRSKCTQ